MKLFYIFVTILALLVYPLCSFAETIARPQEEQEDTGNQSAKSTRPSSANTQPTNTNVNRPSNDNNTNASSPTQNVRPSQNTRHNTSNVNRPTQNTRPSTPNVSRPTNNRPAPNRPNDNNRPNVHTPNNNARPVHYSNSHITHQVSRPHNRVYYVARRTYTPYYAPVVVYNSTSTVEYAEPVVEEESTEEVVSVEDKVSNKVFGFGISGVIATNSAIGNLKAYSSGGFGFYIKCRPIRYFSIEFTNDYLFGTLKYTDWYNQGFIKVPLTLGARIHFLDYGSFDTYAALAASLSIISYNDGYDYMAHEYVSRRCYQYGGQFGLGFGFIAGIFEVGIDVRYTIESVPDYIPYYISNDDSVIHGGLFTLSVGFAL